MAIPGTQAASSRIDEPFELPIFFEDEGFEEMGESYFHSKALMYLLYALELHFHSMTGWELASDMNVHYHPMEPRAYISPDLMAVKPYAPLSKDLGSYRIGEQGPVPEFVAEVLSRRTAQQGDLTHKMDLYAELGVTEYLLVDTTGRWLPERLVLRTLNADKTWTVQKDEGNGVNSQFGFRVKWNADGWPRVENTQTGKPYPWPEDIATLEAQAEEYARKAQALEADLAIAEYERNREAAARQAETQARFELEARLKEVEAELAKRKGSN